MHSLTPSLVCLSYPLLQLFYLQWSQFSFNLSPVRFISILVETEEIRYDGLFLLAVMLCCPVLSCMHKASLRSDVNRNVIYTRC